MSRWSTLVVGVTFLSGSMSIGLAEDPAPLRPPEITISPRIFHSPSEEKVVEQTAGQVPPGLTLPDSASGRADVTGLPPPPRVRAEEAATPANTDMPPTTPAMKLTRRRFYVNPFDTDLQTINWASWDNPWSYPISEDGTPDSLPWNPAAGWKSRGDLFNVQLNQDSAFQLDGLVRGYYKNDQRIEWSGVEATGGAEAVLRPEIRSSMDRWTVSAEAEVFLNQRFGTSILSDPQRDLYRSNFIADQFQIFQLFVQAKYDDFIFRAGRSRTPFGRFQSPMFTNALIDAPFLRTDVISFTETGCFVRWQPMPFVLDLAIVNGESDLDTNSSKGVIARVGLDEDFWTVGLSGKVQDGIGSEYQKRFNNHAGIDFSLRADRLFFYGEAVIDKHGLVRDYSVANTNVYNYGIRSLYGRDAYNGSNKGISGAGFYLGVAYRSDNYVIDFNYGSYRSQAIGNPVSDPPVNRAILKATYYLTSNLQVYGLALIENQRITEAADPLLGKGNPRAIAVGMQFGF